MGVQPPLPAGLRRMTLLAGCVQAAAARARAAIAGRDYVIPDDVKALALPALRHRVILSPAAEIEGRQADQVIQGLIDRVEAPR